ncbi:hypothetical protein V2G26_007570 [Clonostachys chloroleuca]
MQNRTSYLQSDLEFFLLLWRPLDEYPGSKDLGQMRMRGSRRKERKSQRYSSSALAGQEVHQLAFNLA